MDIIVCRPIAVSKDKERKSTICIFFAQIQPYMYN